MLVTKHVQESCVRYHITAVNYNSEKNKMRERKRKKREGKRGIVQQKGFAQEKKTNPIEKIEVWRFY